MVITDSLFISKHSTLLSQSKSKRNTIPYPNRFTIHCTRFPFWHRIYESQSFLVQSRINTSQHLCIRNASVLFYYKPNNYPSLNIILFSCSRIIHVRTQECHHSGSSTWVTWHIINYIKSLRRVL